MLIVYGLVMPHELNDVNIVWSRNGGFESWSIVRNNQTTFPIFLFFFKREVKGKKPPIKWNKKKNKGVEKTKFILDLVAVQIIYLFLGHSNKKKKNQTKTIILLYVQNVDSSTNLVLKCWSNLLDRIRLFISHNNTTKTWRCPLLYRHKFFAKNY